LQGRVLSGRFHVTVNAASADGCGCLAVERLLEVIFVVSGPEIGSVAFVLFTIIFRMDY
jgi:hypothetical protein